MASPLFNEKLRRPSISFTEMLKKGAGGFYRERNEYTSFMYRAVVVAVDTEGGKLENTGSAPTPLEQEVHDGGKTLAKYTVYSTQGPTNPPNSVRARIITDNIDYFIDDESLRTFWPLFSSPDTPSPGELVYVVFEDEEMTHGLWVCRIPTNVVDLTQNQALMSQQLQTAKANNKTILLDLMSSSDQATVMKSGVPTKVGVRDTRKLSSLFIDTPKP